MFRASKLVTWAAASLLLVGCSVIASVARADGNARVEFPISVLFPNPCNSENVTLHGAADIMYHTNATGAGGAHYVVEVRFKGKGSGNLGNDYVVSLMANGQFDAPTSTVGTTLHFQTTYHAEFISKGSAPNFSLEGTIDVGVDNGVPTNIVIVLPFANAVCKG
jgi:hypothetical protein